MPEGGSVSPRLTKGKAAAQCGEGLASSCGGDRGARPESAMPECTCTSPPSRRPQPPPQPPPPTVAARCRRAASGRGRGHEQMDNQQGRRHVGLHPRCAGSASGARAGLLLPARRLLRRLSRRAAAPSPVPTANLTRRAAPRTSSRAVPRRHRHPGGREHVPLPKPPRLPHAADQPQGW